MNNKQQQGFILALALLMMLFVGLVVITSTERTGQETRVSQSDAPTATLQAAAEAGLLTLRQKINTAADSGICKDEANLGVEEFCGCIENVSLADLMDGENGYPGHEKEFSSKEGLPDVYWWFVKDQQEENFITCFQDEKDGDPRCNDPAVLTTGSDICRVVANVFVGDPKSGPSHFMAGAIDIKLEESEFSDSIKNVFGLGDGEGITDISMDVLNSFYDDDLLDDLDVNVFAIQKLASGSTLDANSLESGKINIVVLDGGLTIETSPDFEGKPLIIVSNKKSVNAVVDNGKPGKGNNKDDKDENGIIFEKGKGGSGAGAGGIIGWVVAPEARIYSESGTPKIDMDVNVAGCDTGNQQSCFHESGGSSFKGYSLTKFDESAGGGNSATGKVVVDKSENMNMSFDY